MKIVINALQYKVNSSGIGIMLRDFCGQYVKMTKRSCQVVLTEDAPAFPVGTDTELIYAPCKYEQGLKRMYFQSFRLGRMYCKDSVLLTTDSKIPLLLPKSCKLFPMITDLAVYKMPKTYQLSRVLWWKLQYQYLKRRADKLIAVSESTKRDIVEILGIPPEKITVIPCAYSESMKPVTDPAALMQLRETYALPEHFILFVGNYNPRKNIHRILQAFDKMKAKTTLPHSLVIAGEQGWKFDSKEALSAIQHRDDVRFIGFVPDEDMPALYSAADLFVFPTLYEGFGVPILEAQACGTPVLTGNHSSLPEVAGDAAIFTDVYDVEQISQSMQKILTNEQLRQTLSDRGLRNVKRFSWKMSAKRLEQFIEENI